MNKKQIIRTVTLAAQAYHSNLEGRRLLFVYGNLGEVRKAMTGSDYLPLKAFSLDFRKENFLHLTGLRLNPNRSLSPIYFYKKCLHNRLQEDDFVIGLDGSAEQKLDILQSMMNIRSSAAMFGEFAYNRQRLYAQKATGNIYGCIGFVHDDARNINVPNTLLKKDIRDVTGSSTQKVYAIYSRNFAEEKYTTAVKLDKCLQGTEIKLPKMISDMIDLCCEGR